ncbi:hypothetical protein [Bowmanella dokdonensis]|uniref:Uncharacterized protein n=1 Tax=Bowmanella dokdonensis TaxID=751969 RepID=A0A939IR88_9ALTE|nr:hypothetical protein [Bowmanella dokdonensis]MBN7827700.1 hypothetical protein [Bowmanella dokdonensis]
MLLFALFGLLILVLIYLLVRNQATQKELNQYKHWQKTGEIQRRFLLENMGYLSHELQSNLIARLNKAHQHQLIRQEDFEVASLILNNLGNVVLMCCEKRQTVQESVKKLVNASALSETRLTQFISSQPSAVRVAWSKNQVGGFITACSHMSRINQLENAKSVKQEAVA